MNLNPAKPAGRDEPEAVQSVTPSNNMPPTQGEAGLLTIPPELRNAIYELIYEFPTGSVDLLKASSPSEATLLVCKQIFNEAKLLYEERCQQYWRNTQFTFSPAGAPLRLRLSETSIANIRNIHFAVKLGWLDPRVWACREEEIAILARHAGGSWYELSVHGITTSPSELLWRIPGGQWAGCEPTEVQIVHLQEASNTQWQPLTTSELVHMLVRRFEPRRL
ncbi:hypothetical protein LTR27_006636 [Elasticomyces elasticus]|nr:hypothetical protein LTR27_006636 [Elasticomyces elasticus]